VNTTTGWFNNNASNTRTTITILLLIKRVMPKTLASLKKKVGIKNPTPLLAAR
jgi:hypothetical protein